VGVWQPSAGSAPRRRLHQRRHPLGVIGSSSIVTPSGGSAFFRPNILMAGVDGLAECTSPAHRPTGTRRSSSTDISVSAPANEGLPSVPRIKVLAWGRDPDTTKVTELEQMMVTGDDRVGSGGKRALEDPVADQRNLRASTPPISSRIAGEMQISIRPARPRASTLSAEPAKFKAEM
jgi:hypothetical protein